MPYSAVYEAATLFRAALLARERRAATALVQFYGSTWQRLFSDIVGLMTEIDALRAEGVEPSQGMIMRLERMQAIQQQLEQEMARYVRFADQSIQDGKRWSISAGERDAYELTRLSFPPGSVSVQFYRMPRDAAESLIGMLADGTPLRDLLTRYVGDAAKKLSETMLTGLVAGWNPRKLARVMRSEFGMGLTESLRIARTEQLRAYRTATSKSYQANGNIVKGWRRLATKDDRTCMACVVLDGKLYALDEEMDDHPQGRCAMIPVTATFAELGIDAPEPQFQPESVREWFESQPEATQRKMLGTGMYDAWRDGRFELDDIPALHKDATWGNGWTPRPLYDLLGESKPVGSYVGWIEQMETAEALP
jgi:SPP1 gp7 family putative phage head morphogenesis protein